MKYGNPNRRGRSFQPQPRNATRPTHGGPTRHRCGLLDYFRTARHEPALPGGGAQQRPGAQVVDGQRFKRVLAVLQEMGADEGGLAVDRHGAASAGAGAAAVVEVHVGHLLVEAHEDGEAGRVLDVPYLAAHVVGGRIRRRVELEYLNSRELLWNEFRRHLPAVDAQKEVIRIGMQRSVFAQEDIHRVLQFEESHPWASVEIASGPQDSFLPALSKGELEAAYVTGLGDHEYENLARIRIVHQPVCVPMAANDPLASRPALDFYADLKGRTILSAGVHTSEANREKLRQAGIGLALLPDSRNVLKEKIIRGQGVAFVLADIAERFEADGMACVPLVNCDLNIDSYLAYRKNLGERVQAFVRHILGFHGLGGACVQG